MAAPQVERAAKLARPALQITDFLPRQQLPRSHILTQNVGMEDDKVEDEEAEKAS